MVLGGSRLIYTHFSLHPHHHHPHTHKGLSASPHWRTDPPNVWPVANSPTKSKQHVRRGGRLNAESWWEEKLWLRQTPGGQQTCPLGLFSPVHTTCLPQVFEPHPNVRRERQFQQALAHRAPTPSLVSDFSSFLNHPLIFNSASQWTTVSHIPISCSSLL